MGFFSSIRDAIVESHLESRRPLAPAEASARHLCAGLELRLGFRPKPLDLHKLLFLSQMILLGRSPQDSLMGELQFQATDVGPICEPLRKRLAIYCKFDKPVPNRAIESPEPFQLEVAHIAALNAVIDGLASARIRERDLGGRLVSILYQDDGAYFRHYIHGLTRLIPRSSMAEDGARMTRLRDVA